MYNEVQMEELQTKIETDDKRVVPKNKNITTITKVFFTNTSLILLSSDGCKDTKSEVNSSRSLYLKTTCCTFATNWYNITVLYILIGLAIHNRTCC